ncbi:MAG TPA: hypothetical protein VIP98_09080 [Microlunatus sp.]
MPDPVTTPQSNQAEPNPVPQLTLRFRPSLLLLCCLLLLVSAVAWRKGSYFSGGFDLVVVVKAALTGLAVAIAWAMPRSKDAWSKVRAAPMLWLVAYLTITVVGGLLNGEPLASTVLAARVMLMALALLLLMVSHSWQAVLGSLASAMLLLAGFGIVTGLPSLAATGRLYGGIPPLNANEICLLVSIPAVLLFWRCVHSHASPLTYVSLAGLVGLVWLTGARAGLSALIIAFMLLIMLSRRLANPMAVLIAAAVPVVLWITFFTPWVSQFASRGDPSNITTLNSRTVAWRAAINYADTVTEHLFGGGLALKQVPVSAMYRTSQILDSTWMSALLQAGLVGTAILVLFVLTTAVRALMLPRPQSHLIFAIVIQLTLVSVLESGLFDSTSAFLTFFTMALCAHRTDSVPVVVTQVPLPSGRRTLGAVRTSRYLNG